jgi:hypothetical protein
MSLDQTDVSLEVDFRTLGEETRLFNGENMYVIFWMALAYVVVALFKLWRLACILDHVLAAQFRMHKKVTGDVPYLYQAFSFVVFWVVILVQSALWPRLLLAERSGFFKAYGLVSVCRSAMRGVQAAHSE